MSFAPGHGRHMTVLFILAAAVSLGILISQGVLVITVSLQIAATPAEAVPSCPWLCDSGMISFEVT